MALALKRFSVLAVTLLSLLASLVIIAEPAQAAVRKEGPYLTRHDCNVVATEFRRYYSAVSSCYYDRDGFYFLYDDASG